MRRPPLRVGYCTVCPEACHKQCNIVQPPDGSPGPEANTILRQDTLGDDRQVTDQGGDRGLGGIRSTGETAGVEGFMTPRSQGLPAISEMVEGIPGVFMSRVSEFFRVARTEVQAQSPPHHTRASPGAVSRVRALGDGSVGSSASPPQPDSIGTPTTFGPGPGRESPLLNAELLQRMQALEQRAPLLYPRSAAPERPWSVPSRHRSLKRQFKQRLPGSLQVLRLEPRRRRWRIRG